ncbi:MAG: PEP-CTERM sorting domain-containing protein [Rheinheimera sp.]
MKKFLLIIATLFFTSLSLQATPIFVGKWDLYDSTGPSWSTFSVPTYTGQEAAALIFGGKASDYVISTISTDPSTIDHMVWLDQIYIGVAKFGESYKVDSNNNGLYDMNGDTSALVKDNGCCGQYINYAFRINNSNTVAEPSPLLLIGLSLIGFGILRRRKLN